MRRDGDLVGLLHVKHEGARLIERPTRDHVGGLFDLQSVGNLLREVQPLTGDGDRVQKVDLQLLGPLGHLHGVALEVHAAPVPASDHAGRRVGRIDEEPGPHVLLEARSRQLRDLDWTLGGRDVRRQDPVPTTRLVVVENQIDREALSLIR